MKYCPHCAHPLEERLVEGEDRPRLVCTACGFIFYLNPKIVAAALPIVDDRVILLRRGIEPRRGTWTYPGGFMELGETVEEAARRECLEETNLQIEPRMLLNVYSRPQAGIVVIVFLADVVGGRQMPTREALEIAPFGRDEIPWDNLAFPSTHDALRDWIRLTSRTAIG